MDIIEESKLELTSKLVAYTEFLLDFKKENDDIYCFYEGKEDRNYYSVRINLSTQSTQQKFYYTCNGKSNVIALENLLSKHSIYSNSNLLFFVDKDFDENKEISNRIYITKFYGIENFYTIEDCFKNILVNEYHIAPKNEDFIKALEIFKTSKSLFYIDMLNINSWLACQADYRRDNNVSTRLKIDDSLRKYFSKDIFENCVKNDFTISLPIDIKDISKYNLLFPDAPTISSESFLTKIEWMKLQKFEEVFRGKFELKFFVCFLKRFQDEIAKIDSPFFKKKYSCPLRFEYATFISQLSSNAITHNCLRKYITENCIK